jgi:hypothetical protein
MAGKFSSLYVAVTIAIVGAEVWLLSSDISFLKGSRLFCRVFFFRCSHVPLRQVFALGRAQELCILLETYWERMNLGHIPVYFSAGSPFLDQEVTSMTHLYQPCRNDREGKHVL